jgi:UDP-N-acetylglucosamine:LPS N-acetylglucosamine transferase
LHATGYALGTALVAAQPERYRVLGYTSDIPDLMRVATLFVGKPGGLSSSKCMATGLPMVLINPIPGQGVRNSDFLLEEGAAVCCNYQTTVGYKIDSLLDDTDRMRRMAAGARAWSTGRRGGNRCNRAGRTVRGRVDKSRCAACDSPRGRRRPLGA